MYWWHKAAELVRAGRAKRFGLITTNCLRQTFARRVVQSQLEASPRLFLVFAIPDHPWVDTADGAAVRIAMTVGGTDAPTGELLEVADEQPLDDGSAKVTFKEKHGSIQADITVGAEVARTVALKANEGLTSMGVMLARRGFVVAESEALVLGDGEDSKLANVLRPIRNGKDLLDQARRMWVVDFTGLTAEEARDQFPALYQIVLTRVKPERDQNRDSQFRGKWWLFGRSRPELRAMVCGVRRYIATVETAKHRVFQFQDSAVLPEHKLVVIGSDDAFILGVVNSRIHVLWSLARGAMLEDRPVYPKTECFDPFAFPACDAAAQERIRKIAEELDAHRKRAQAQNPGLTLTGMYNVMEKLRANQALNAKEKQIHDAGLVSVLRQLHDDLDAAVFAAYGWPPTLTDAEILERLVALNAERAKEEASGLVRWLRPDYQNPGGAQTQQTTLAVEVEPKAKPGKQRAGKLAWPKTLSERVKAVSTALATVKEPVTAPDMAQRFSRARPADLGEILETLCAMGKGRRGKADGTFLP